MKKILVTGANGQLGRCIQDAASGFPDCEFVFFTKEELDIESSPGVEAIFQKHHFDYCINTAAYTNVEKAEGETKKAFAINADAVQNMALLCEKSGVVLIHISTDYVFDGKKSLPYLETDPANPINVYGASKLKGEQYIQEISSKYFIFRTSWLYSQYGHNFLKTILRYAEEGKPLTITTEQTGTPTNANDLAEVILNLIQQDLKDYGVYHFSNAGETTWFGFAEEILLQTDLLDNTKLVKTKHYTTFAARPDYSVLDNGKSQNELQVKRISWQKSLKPVLKKLIKS